MKTLTQILQTAAQVRAEQQESENTAERVGGVLCDLTEFLQNKTALTGLSIKTDMNGVSVEVRAQTGDGQEAATVLKFPEATETQSGIITTVLMQQLRAEIEGNNYAIQNISSELQESLSKITALESKTTYNGDNITKLFSAANTHDTKIAAAEKAISAAQASIEENADNIATMGFQLTAIENKADTATRVLTFDGEVRNPTIQMQGISTYDSILFDTARCLFLAYKSGKYYNAFPGSDDYNDITGDAMKARTSHLFLRTDTQLVYTFDGTSLNPFILSSAQKDKLAAYPAQFVLDLGLVPNESEGDARAASSEVAGNRNISFIRFKTQGVSNLKTTLILQFPNGINETAQIKFVDKTEWRRNVTGATGVAGAPTNAFTWERTAPHYLGYDAANRKIQLKDYQQMVIKDVELPLATASTAGLLSTADYAKIQACSSAVTTHNTKLNEHETRLESLGNSRYETIERVEILEDSRTDHETRIQTLENIHAPSDMVEMTIQNDKAQRNVLFFKVEWIDDLEIDGRPINTEGLSGKFYRSLSVGEHKVRFRVSAENQTKRGLLGWADDESAGYLSHVTKIVIPEGWEELPANCFESRKHLEEVVLPSTLKVVGGNCFQSLPALRELVIPKNVVTINWSAVNNCEALKSIRIGGAESMPLTISFEAFRNCAALTCIEILPCQLTFKGSTSPFSNLPNLNALICHLTTAPTFEPSTPFGTIGSGTTERKTLYRPAGVAFYDEGAWLNNLRNGLGFYVADI